MPNGPVVRARHVGYTAGAKRPVVRLLPSVQCSVPLPTFLEARHIGYTPQPDPPDPEAPPKPKLAWAYECCDVVDTCRVEVDELAAWLPDGVTRRVLLTVTDVQGNCRAANGLRAVLTYCGPNAEPDCDGVDTLCSPGPPITGCDTCDVAGRGKWVGRIAMPSGDLDLELCYWVDGPDLRWRLRYSGCQDGCLDGTVNCEDNPLIIEFPQTAFNDCCNCDDDHTDASATIVFRVWANCREPVFARHIDYTADGIPVVAHVHCHSGTLGPTGCMPQCPLVAEITGQGACACLDGVYTLDYNVVGADWVNNNIGPCSGLTRQARMTCEVLLDGGGNATGYVRLTFEVVCGATNTGSASVDVWWTDLETLDVTFNFTMGGVLDCCLDDVEVRVTR